jgi:hypothetical protein
MIVSLTVLRCSVAQRGVEAVNIKIEERNINSISKLPKIPKKKKKETNEQQTQIPAELFKSTM